MALRTAVNLFTDKKLIESKIGDAMLKKPKSGRKKNIHTQN